MNVDGLILTCRVCGRAKSILVFALSSPVPVCEACVKETDVCPGCDGEGQRPRRSGGMARHIRCHGTGRVPGGDRLPGTPE